MAPQVAVERASAKGSSTPSDGFGGATRKQASLESWAIASATILVMIVEWSRPFHDRCGFGRRRRSEDSHTSQGPARQPDAGVVGCRNLPGGGHGRPPAPYPLPLPFSFFDRSDSGLMSNLGIPGAFTS